MVLFHVRNPLARVATDWPWRTAICELGGAECVGRWPNQTVGQTLSRRLAEERRAQTAPWPAGSPHALRTRLAWAGTVGAPGQLQLPIATPYDVFSQRRQAGPPGGQERPAGSLECTLAVPVLGAEITDKPGQRRLTREPTRKPNTRQRH